MSASPNPSQSPTEGVIERTRIIATELEEQGFAHEDAWASAHGIEEALASHLRSLGWTIAVHNDYRLNGEAHTFWLWTHVATGRFIKGEGRSDADALAECIKARSSLPTDKRPA